MTIDKTALLRLQTDLRVQVNRATFSGKPVDDVLLAIYHYQVEPSDETESALKRNINQYGYQHYGVFK